MAQIRPQSQRATSNPLVQYAMSTTNNNPEHQNELNYQAWKNEHAQRKRELRTQFNIWRDRQSQRMNNHQVYKTESVEQAEKLKELLHERLDKACSCQTCRLHERSRRYTMDDARRPEMVKMQIDHMSQSST